MACEEYCQDKFFVETMVKFFATFHDIRSYIVLHSLVHVTAYCEYKNVN